MKASEVIKRYNSGERDFRRVSLRGESFKRQNLAGADFSEADIRGANFTNAKLRGAKFCDAKAGLQRRWATSLVISSWILAGISGILLTIAGYLVSFILNSPRLYEVLAGWTALITVVTFFFVTISKGLRAGLGTVTGIVAGTVVISGIFALTEGVAGRLGGGAFVTTASGAIAGIGAIAGTFAGVVAGASSGIVAGAIGGITVTFVVALAVALVTVSIVVVDIANAPSGAGTVTIAVSIAIIFLNTWISWLVLNKGKSKAWVCPFAIAFAATGGTSFYNADLTEVDFTGATLKSTNLRKATLTRTKWYKSQKLDHARVGNSILSDAAIRDLLISGYGYKKSYVKANLRGANLAGTNLSYANLKCADLSEASLVRANLEWANLTETNAIGTDFTGVSLTGACLEAFNLDSKTKLEQVDCRFVYLLEHPNPETGDRERRPHDLKKVFEPGDFAKLYKKVMNTVQILLRNGVNDEAFHTAFRQIMEYNPEINFDSIQSIQKKEEDVLVTIQVPQGTDKGKFEQQFFEVYQARLEAKQEAALREAETRHNQDIKEIALAALTKNQSSNPIFNVTNTATNEGKVMNESSDNSSKIETRDGNVIGNILGDSSTISGTVTNTINELPASAESDQPGIKELLIQLQTAIASESNLDEEDKAEALEQVKLLAEAGKNPSDGAMKKLAKRATTMLKGLIAGLPTAATLVETSKELLPAITNLFNL
ncbi:MAG: hypothetical protein F6J89_11505 [Symploca sp. SIO1C4]|uniref:Pentapeptide repeat-containing protein n=1 Tax=Symploca sp. SIO1C4 TaxID=2607765 RepID=A0A6B3NEZ8_9CYAN|nr:hypothetical protein [Symploca sp. SIO1C4]